MFKVNGKVKIKFQEMQVDVLNKILEYEGKNSWQHY